MKKLIAAAVVALSFASFAAGAHPTHSKASDYCKDHDDQPAFGTTTPTKSEVNQEGVAFVDVDGHGAGVCVNQGPVQGSVAAQHAGGNQGWVVVDGDPSNPGALGGYVVVQAGDNDRNGVKSRCSGNYDHDNTLDYPLGVQDPRDPGCAP